MCVYIFQKAVLAIETYLQHALLIDENQTTEQYYLQLYPLHLLQNALSKVVFHLKFNHEKLPFVHLYRQTYNYQAFSFEIYPWKNYCCSALQGESQKFYVPIFRGVQFQT